MWFVAAMVGLPTLLIILTMSGALGPILRDGQSLWRIPYLLVANTPTGGDMGAHVFLPKELLESILPTGRLMGWSMDWYAGFPALYFYFPLPALTTVALDLALPYGIAFKLTTIVGVVALPAVSYLFVRFLGFPRLVAMVAGVSASIFVFMESYSIFGANIKSTLAGEFSYSWGFALSILYVGLVVRDYRNRRRFNPWAAILLGVGALAHVISTIVAVVTVLPLALSPLWFAVVKRDRFRGSVDGALGVLSSWIVGFGVSAFWALAMGVRVLEGLTTDMGWSPVRTVTGHYQAPGSPIPGELVPILAIAVVGVLWSLFRREKVLVPLWMTLWPLAGYFLIAHFEFTVLYNARLLPYWFYGVYLFAGFAIAFGAIAVGRRFADRRQATLIATAAACVVLVGSAAIAMHDLPGWVKWNYEGYEGKQTWPEYENLLETVDALPDGRVMWEVNRGQNAYGTPMALMLLPYWSEGHPSMEGVFFESSLTTPFHFLNASEVSHQPSNPVRGLTYRPMNFERADKHLPVYDIDYYVSFTDEATAAATDHGWEILAEPEPWTVYAAPEADRVEVATAEPVVWAGDDDFVEAALDWYDDVDNLDTWVAEDGPADWRRISDLEQRFDEVRSYEVAASVEITTFENHTIRFTTDAVGIPHLVKVSWFPNWQVDGADGVYRIAPSLMLVIPTESEVTLQFGLTWVEVGGAGLTAVTIVGLGIYGIVALVRRKKRTA